MSRVRNRLSTRAVASLKQPGRHADGGGLYLRVTPHGSKSWVFMKTVSGKRQEIGLGPVSSVGLAAARDLSVKLREAAALGNNPRSVLAKFAVEPPKKVPTFEHFADQYITSIEGSFKSPVHRHQWRQSLQQHANMLHPLAVDAVETEHVLQALRPIWLTKPETANRVRGRIERVLDAAKAMGHRSPNSINPAQLRGHLAILLGKQPRLVRGHHAALDWRSIPQFMKELRQRPANSARALEFTILTAARSGETLGATWGEIDFEQKLWTIPPARMKAGAGHVVPLSTAALSVLVAVKPISTSPSDVVFSVKGVARSNMAMAQLLKRMQHGHITTHGFRSTFRDWAGDGTGYPRELIEQALAHTIANKAERAYRRGQAVERRRELMQAWADYLSA